MKFAVFAKHLQSWPLTECVTRVREAGFDGLDLTVRPGGYVEPGAGLAPALASAVRTIRSAGLDVPLITTGLTSASDPAAEPTLRLASELGIREAKLHYWPWESGMALRQAVDGARRDLDGLERLARACGVRVNIHNHSGDHVQNSPWTIAELLRDRDPSAIGCYFDPAHFTLEGGLSGWRAAVELLGARITLLAVKDGKWVDVAGARMPSQERRWVPVGTGTVRWPAVLSGVRSAGFDGWASIHGEYQGRWSWRDLSSAEVLSQCVDDRNLIAATLAEIRS
jgi:sugar phosphate isomerase/epimerase